MQKEIMVCDMRKIQGFICLTALSAAFVAPIAFTSSNVWAQGTNLEQRYDVPAGHAFNPNKDGSKVFNGARSEFEKRADVYEEENFRSRLEEQARQKHLRRFSIHRLNRLPGSESDY